MALIHSLAGMAMLASPLPLWLRGFAVATVLMGWLVSRRGLRRPVIGTLRLGSAGEWILQAPSGQETPAKLLPSTVLLPWLLVLHFRASDGRFYAVPVLADSVEAGQFRRLVVRLRVAPLGAGGEPNA